MIGVGRMAVLLLMRALQCQWNFIFESDKRGTTDMGVITKAYASLFTPSSKLPEASVNKVPPIIPAVDPKAGTQTVVYTSSSSRQVYAIRQGNEFTTVPDHHIYLAICRAAHIPSVIATGNMSRSSSVNLDKELDNYDC
jgi:hypothetical protein